MIDYNEYKAKEEGKKIVKFNKFLAGVLLVFDKIDYIDLSMLVDEFEKQEKAWVSGYFNIQTLPNPIQYNYFREQKDGTIMFNINGNLNESYDLESKVRGDGRSLKEVLEEVAGRKICNFFKKINKVELEKRKQEQIKEYKEKALTDANILLISGDKSEYDELETYGFKNIDWFDSILNADKYFLEHPEEFSKFHVVLKGDYPKRSEWLFLESQLGSCSNSSSCNSENPYLILDFYTLFENDKKSLHGYGYCAKGSRTLQIDAPSFKDYFDFLVGNLFVNQILERKQKIEIKQHIEEFNPLRLSLPTKKKDLKILYCPTIDKTALANLDVSNSLGLNVTLKEDNNNTLDKILKEDLGDYDIILVSNLYSGSLINWNKECTAQCRTTGRDLVMLVTYDDKDNDIYNEVTQSYIPFGTKIDLKYNFAGRLAPTVKTKYITYSSLKEDWQVTDEEIAERDSWCGTLEAHKKFISKEKSVTAALLKAVANLYNEALLNIKAGEITDLDLKSVDELSNEYKVKEEEFKNKLKEEIAPIKAFDELALSVQRYLIYKNRGYVLRDLKGLMITEENNVIKVSNVLNDKIMCTITFSEEIATRGAYSGDNKWIRIFDVQTLTKKETLTLPQRVGFYTSQYESVSGIPPRPDEKQANSLYATLKKVNAILVPVLNEAQESPAVLNYRRKNKRY